ncbi:MAG: dihydrolipoamide succinyltransferase, partial [Alphaproteobacteria bacterium]
LYEASIVIARLLEKPEEDEDAAEAPAADAASPAGAPAATAPRPAAAPSQVFEENDFNLAR